MFDVNITKGSQAEFAELAQVTEANLLQALADENDQAANSSFCYAALTRGGDFVGGLVGSTSYGWLLVKAMWVSATHRRMGVASRLMLAAEEQARKLGCHSAWLDTSSAQARLFYSRMGFIEFAELTNELDQQPSRHQRWFMKKRITAPGPPEPL